MKYLRWLLFPFSLIYGLVVIIRNWCYDAGFFKVHRFSKPVICVGNLDVGGAGKSPMTEYLVRLLKPDLKIAILSRGYGRSSKGYIDKVQEADMLNIATLIGDEPAQFKSKFPDITVAVCENRVEGIRKLLPDHDLVLMDDAYQHRSVEAGLNILLFDYNRVNEPHLLLPAGNLREPFSGRWRAQLIVITKCPVMLSENEKQALAQRVDPLPYQQLFFSSIVYQPLQNIYGSAAGFDIDGSTTVFLLTGIANAGPLINNISAFTTHLIHHNYPDHHRFTLKNISKLAADFAACKSQKKIIITTEKDAQRLQELRFDTGATEIAGLPVFVISIKVEFLTGSGAAFDQIINTYVREHSKNYSIH